MCGHAHDVIRHDLTGCIQLILNTTIFLDFRLVNKKNENDKQ